MKYPTTKSSLLSIALLLVLFIFPSCGEDDDIVIPIEGLPDLIEATRAATTLILTDGTSKTWKISNATLDANGTIIDLSDTFNIVDDEFIFSGTAQNGILEWRPGNAINLEATSAQDALLDYYLEPINATTTFNDESGTDLTSLDGAFSFMITEESTITGTLTTSGRQMTGTLNVTLTPKTNADYRSPPSNGLDFSFVSSIMDDSSFLSETTGGLIGSYSDSSLFLASRNNGNEQILKYSLNDNNWSSSLYTQSQFVTKRLNIINNELVVFGGQIATTYPLNPNGTPLTEFNHNIGLTRFGFTVQGDLGYIVGNSVRLPDLEPAKVRTYNYLDNSFQVITTLPKPRVYGAAAIINGELLVFGGRTFFTATSYDDLDGECFKIDIATGAISSFNMPQAATISYAARVENLIYVGYETRTDDDNDGDLAQDNRTVNFAVYNTLDGSFTEISHNLDDSDMFTSIHAITIFNDKLFVVLAEPLAISELKIFAAPLN